MALRTHVAQHSDSPSRNIPNPTVVPGVATAPRCASKREIEHFDAGQGREQLTSWRTEVHVPPETSFTLPGFALGFQRTPARSLAGMAFLVRVTTKNLRSTLSRRYKLSALAQFFVDARSNSGIPINRLSQLQVALVTGSTSGITLPVAHQLAKAGAGVVLNDSGNTSEIEKLRAVMETKYGVPVRYSGADMGQPPAANPITGIALLVEGGGTAR